MHRVVLKGGKAGANRFSFSRTTSADCSDILETLHFITSLHFKLNDPFGTALMVQKPYVLLTQEKDVESTFPLTFPKQVPA